MDDSDVTRRDRPAFAQVQPRLVVGQVLLVRRRGLVGWLIRRVTRSAWNHAALVDQTQSGVWVTVEASDNNRVTARLLTTHLHDQTVTGLLLRDSSLLTFQDRQRIMEAAWLQVGRRYDTLQLAGIYLRRRLPWLFGGSRCALAENRLDSRDRLICSELVTVAYLKGAGMRLAPEGVAVGNVDPGHLATTAKLFTVWSWQA